MTTITKDRTSAKTPRNTSLMWFKECPKCQGDLWMDRDMYGPFVACLQCGYYLNETQMKALMRGDTVRPAAGHAESERDAMLVA